MAFSDLDGVSVPSVSRLALETTAGVNRFTVVDADLQSDGTTQVALVGSHWLALGTYPATYIEDETSSAGRFALHGCIRSGESIQFLGVFCPH